MFTWYSILLSGRPCIFSDTERQRGSDRETARERDCLPCLTYFTVVDRFAFVLAFFQIQRDKETETERRRVIERERYR